MMDWMARTALELIGQGGLGYSFNLFEETKTNAFSDALNSFMYDSATFPAAERMLNVVP